MDFQPRQLSVLKEASGIKTVLNGRHDPETETFVKHILHGCVFAQRTHAHASDVVAAEARSA